MAADDCETEDLIRRAGAGEEAATEKLLARYRDRLRQMVSVRMNAQLAARLDASRSGTPTAAQGSVGDPGPLMAPGEAPAAPQSASVELGAYREAYNTWRTDDYGACIDRFREFLQTYPSSEYADDAAYWMADCYFKQGDYQTAILRFDDVAGRYPTSGKAPEALYRQGEALLRLGPRYGKAARRAFERVINEYPNSARVEEARRQLELIGPD